MVDSTNPRVMADNIKELAARESGTVVEANPTGATTADLEKLGVDGTIYGIPKVEANPEGAVTAELEKLGVDDTIYSISNYTPVAYSTTEVNTGQKWIDGSDIYMITVVFNDSITTSSKELIDMTSNAVNELIKCEYAIKEGAITYFGAMNNISIGYSSTTKKVNVNVATGSYSNGGTFTFFYTKTASE